MSLVWTDELPLDAELSRVARSVKQDGPFAWQFDLGADAALRGSARIETDWLLFDVPLRRGRSQSWPDHDRLVRLLEWNALLPSGAKFAWDRGDRRIHVQAELPQGPDANPMAKLDALFDGIGLAIDAYQSTRSVAANMAIPVVAEGSTERRDAWKRLCEETGWPCHDRAGDRLAVTLDVPGTFVAALLEPHDGTGMRARLELDAELPTPAAKTAGAALLLSAGRVVRMARTYVSGDWNEGAVEQKPGFSECSETPANASENGSPASPSGENLRSQQTNGASTAPMKFGWDVVFGESPAAHELDRGLSALSMAARLTLNEMRALADDRVARRFLAVQGMVP